MRVLTEKACVTTMAIMPLVLYKFVVQGVTYRSNLHLMTLLATNHIGHVTFLKDYNSALARGRFVAHADTHNVIHKVHLQLSFC